MYGYEVWFLNNETNSAIERFECVRNKPPPASWREVFSFECSTYRFCTQIGLAVALINTKLSLFSSYDFIIRDWRVAWSFTWNWTNRYRNLYFPEGRIIIIIIIDWLGLRLLQYMPPIILVSFHRSLSQKTASSSTPSKHLSGGRPLLLCLWHFPKSICWGG